MKTFSIKNSDTKQFGNPIVDEMSDSLNEKLMDFIHYSNGAVSFADVIKYSKNYSTPSLNRSLSKLLTKWLTADDEGDRVTADNILPKIITIIKNGEKTFSDKINSEDEFRKYAHTVMKEAHGDEYSEEVTNKVVDDLIKNNPDADWGELVGRLTSGFGDKTMSAKEIGKVIVDTSNPEKLGKLIEMIKNHGNPGHSFECAIDQGDENEESWSWDGDGSDRIDEITIINKKESSRTFSEKVFANHSKTWEAAKLEVDRLKDLYDDIKSKQKADDPSQKVRNKMLLQEVKVKLEQAKYNLYKIEFKES